MSLLATLPEKSHLHIIGQKYSAKSSHTSFEGLGVSTSPGGTAASIPNILIRPLIFTLCYIFPSSHKPQLEANYIFVWIKNKNKKKLSLYLEDCLQDYTEIELVASLISTEKQQYICHNKTLTVFY